MPILPSYPCILPYLTCKVPLEPEKEYGYGYLEAIRTVFGPKR